MYSSPKEERERQRDGDDGWMDERNKDKRRLSIRKINDVHTVKIIFLAYCLLGLRTLLDLLTEKIYLDFPHLNSWSVGIAWKVNSTNMCIFFHERGRKQTGRTSIEK